MITKALGDCGRGVLGERIKMPSIICYSSPYILLCFYFPLPLCISFIPKSVKQYKRLSQPIGFLEFVLLSSSISFIRFIHKGQPVYNVENPDT